MRTTREMSTNSSHPLLISIAESNINDANDTRRRTCSRQAETSQISLQDQNLESKEAQQVLLMWSQKKTIPSVAVAIYAVFVFCIICPVFAQSGRQMSDESLELGKKWMTLAQAATRARLTADDMRAALQRMESDQSDAAWRITQTKMGIALAAVNSLGDLACGGLSTAWEKACTIGKDLIATFKGAWECGDGSAEHCAGTATSYFNFATGMYSRKGFRVVDGQAAYAAVQNKEFGLDQVVAICDGTGYSNCPVVALVKNAKEAMEVRELKGQLDRMFANNLRMGNAALQRVERQTQELERQVADALAAYRTQREKDEAIKAERIMREQAEMAQAKKEYEEREREVKRHQEDSEQAKRSPPASSQEAAQQGLERTGVERTPATGHTASSDNNQQSSGTATSASKSFDVTVWNYGDPVPGVERPAEFDKPKRNVPCHFKDTSCLDSFNEATAVQSDNTRNPSSTDNPLRPRISHEQIRQEIEEKVKGGLFSSRQKTVSPGTAKSVKKEKVCDENLGCPDDEDNSKGPNKDLLAKLDSDLDRIQNSQPGTAGGLLLGENLDGSEAGSSYDKLAMLKSLRSGLNAYRQGRESFSSPSHSFSSGSFGGNCPNMIAYPPALMSITQRRGTPLPPMPTVDEMIRQGGGVENASSALRQHIQEQQQSLAQWPRGREEEVRRQLELTLEHNQQILRAFECRSSGRSTSQSAPVTNSPNPRLENLGPTQGPSRSYDPCRGNPKCAK